MQTTERPHHDLPTLEPGVESMQGPPGPPNRRARRIHLRREVQIQIADLDGFVAGCAENVSATGMFVRCRTPRPPGAIVGFEFRLTDGSPLIRGRGEVMWVRHRDADPDRPAGMGLRFLDLDPEGRQLISWTVEQRSRRLRSFLRRGDRDRRLETAPEHAPSELEELCLEVENALLEAAIDGSIAFLEPAIDGAAGPGDAGETDGMEELSAAVEGLLEGLLPAPEAPGAAAPLSC